MEDSEEVLNACDEGFGEHLIKFAIYPVEYKYPHGESIPEPDNIEELRDSLSEERDDTSEESLTETEFDDFKNKVAVMREHEENKAVLLPVLEGQDAYEEMTRTAFCYSFLGLNKLTNRNLECGGVDVFYGNQCAEWKEHLSNQGSLEGLILPHAEETSPPDIPSFLVKVHDGETSPSLCEAWTRYNGALAARGVQQLQNMGIEGLELDGKAYVLSAVLSHDVLRIYAHYPIRPHPLSRCDKEVEVGYAMIQVDAWVLSSSLETFRAGITAYRNAKHWAEENIGKVVEANIF